FKDALALPDWTAVATNTRSPQMMGEAWASPGIGVCHRTFSFFSTFQRTGGAAEESIPQAWTPRNCGQSAATAVFARSKAQPTRRFILCVKSKGGEQGQVNELTADCADNADKALKPKIATKERRGHK